MSRWVRFFFMIAIGFGIGLLYGWVIDPVDYIDTVPDTLRADYKTDYVLMVAEIYQQDNDIGKAAERLSFLGDEDPQTTVSNAIQLASQVGYPPPDLELLGNLYDALQAISDSGELE
ncbi:MAG: hypothetical protein GWN30_21660 [Gammaproteobacteria bacterium]|nr:hypothetical protein [Gammaproteobacteria bacterium]